MVNDGRVQKVIDPQRSIIRCILPCTKNIPISLHRDESQLMRVADILALTVLAVLCENASAQRESLRIGVVDRRVGAGIETSFTEKLLAIRMSLPRADSRRNGLTRGKV